MLERVLLSLILISQPEEQNSLSLSVCQHRSLSSFATGLLCLFFFLCLSASLALSLSASNDETTTTARTYVSLNEHDKRLEQLHWTNGKAIDCCVLLLVIMGDFNNLSAMIRALKEGGNITALTGGDPHNLHSGRAGAWKAKISHYAKQINSSDQRSLFIFSKTNWIRKRANDVIDWK